MKHTTQRSDSRKVQYQRATPPPLQHMQGQKVTFYLPCVDGRGCVPVKTTIGRSIKFSLRTEDETEADLRRCAINTQLEQLLAANPEPISITQKQAFALAQREYKQLIELFDANPGTDLQHWPSMVALLSDRESWVRNGFIDGHVQIVLEREQIRLDEASLDRLRHAIGIVMVRGYKLLQRRVEGDYDPDDYGPKLPQPDQVKQSTDAVSISGTFQRYDREAVKRGLSEATRKKYGGVFSKFVAFLSHDNLADVTAKDVAAFKDHRLQVEDRSIKTVRNGDLPALKAVFGWACDNALLDEDPAKDITIKRAPRGRESEAKRGYSEAAAQCLVATALRYQRQKHDKSKKDVALKRFVPLLLAFTGARIGEIVQLRKQDIIIDADAGCYIAAIMPEAGSVKSNKSRRVPLHPQILEQGFIDYWSTAQSGYLFLNFDPTEQSRARLGAAADKVRRFAKHIITEPGVSPNHGWRHRFITECRRLGVDPEKRRMIVGHAGEGTDEVVYGEPVGLYAEICKLPRFDLAVTVNGT